MTQKQSKEKRSNEIVHAAVEVFLERGYGRTSMDAIALRAKLSKGGIYHHFKSKDEILIYANKVFTAPVEVMMKQLAINESKAEGLKSFISGYLNYWKEHPKELQFYFLSINKAFTDESLLQLYQDFFRQELNLFTEVYRISISNGELKKMDVRSIAFSLISAMDGSLAYLAFDNEQDVTDVIHSFQFLFVDNFKS